MSHLLEQDTASESSENEDEDFDNCFESNDTDSIHFDDDEEEERSVLSLSYNPSERLIGGSIIFHIDQANALQQTRAGRSTFSVPIPPYESRSQSTSGIGATNMSTPLPLPHADQSTSTTTTLSESDNLSTQAVLGDTPSTTALNPVPGEDDLDNSSQASMADPDAERVRRIHNSIFSSLEHDLAELVRIREETIQFLETGTRGNEGSGFNSENEHISTRDLNNNGESDDVAQQSTPADGQAEPFFLRERLTFPSRPFRRVNYSASQGVTDDVEDTNPNTITMNGRSYTPTAKFDDVEPGKPGKPYLETGLASCDEKANAARKIVDKLQYGDPEDESACFIRRFWRETSTVVDSSPSQTEPLSSTTDASTLIQRTESLQASLEEAFGGLRLRLQQVQAQAAEHARLVLESEGTTPGESSQQEDVNREILGESSQGVSSNNQNSEVRGEAPSYFNTWDEETSIMNNPLNYDIWDELVDGNDAGPTITARINLSEPRPTSNGRTFNPFGPRQRFNTNTGCVTTSTVSVGTDSGNMDDEGAELDDEDEDVLNFLRFRNSANGEREDSRDTLRNFRSETRDFFRGIGISEEAGRDIFNMFTLAEDSVPSARNGGDDVTLSTSEIPEPFLLPNNNGGVNNCEGPTRGAESDEDIDYLEGVLHCTCSEGDEDDDEVGVIQNAVEQMPLVDTTECSLFVPNREDDCSTRVYLDENDLTFAHSSSNPENQEAQQ